MLKMIAIIFGTCFELCHAPFRYTHISGSGKRLFHSDGELVVNNSIIYARLQSECRLELFP